MVYEGSREEGRNMKPAVIIHDGCCAGKVCHAYARSCAPYIAIDSRTVAILGVIVLLAGSKAPPSTHH